MSTLLPMLGLSLAAYLLGMAVHRRARSSMLLHPVVVAMFAAVAVLLLLAALGRPMAEDYFAQNALFLEGLLVSITAFALPLIDNARQLMRDLARILAVVAIAGVTSGAVTVLVCIAFGVDPGATGALALRTVTNPMAVVIADANALPVDVAMLGVFITGVVGLIIGERSLAAMGVRDVRQVGLMLGIVSHTFGVVRALEISPLAAAYATVGMIVTGLFYAFTVPWVLLVAGTVWPQ